MSAAEQIPASGLQMEDAKAWATLKARAALAGHSLYRTVDEGEVRYFAQRWSMSRGFNDLESVERWLRQIGA